MSGNQCASVFELDSPQLIIDLDILDKNLGTMVNGLNGKNLRIHFKSLKCGGLVKYLMGKGHNSFLCAKLNEAEVLADIGVKNILIANQIVGDLKIARVDSLKTKANVKICIDCEEHLFALSNFAQKFNTSFDVSIYRPITFFISLTVDLISLYLVELKAFLQSSDTLSPSFAISSIKLSSLPDFRNSKS